MDDDERWNWRDQPGVTWAAGAAAVALIALLLVAVIRTSTTSHPVGVLPSGTSIATTSGSAGATFSLTTSYPVPSVQTSDGAGPGVSTPPAVEAPPAGDPTTTSATTTPNPYVTTTTQNGGAV